MHITFRDPADGEIIGGEDGSEGQFAVRPDGTVWYRNELAEGDLFANRTESEFRRAVDALHRYNAAGVATASGVAGECPPPIEQVYVRYPHGALRLQRRA